MNKCIKVILNKCLNMNIKDVKNIIKNMNELSCKASNKAIKMWNEYDENKKDKFSIYLEEHNQEYENDIEKRIKNEINKSKNINDKRINQIKKGSRNYIKKVYSTKFSKEYDKMIKEKYGKTYQNVIEGCMKQIMDICNTCNVGTLHQQQVQNDWGRLKNEVLEYKANLPTYRLDTPIYIKNKNYILRNHNGYFVDISLFSKKGLKEIEQKCGFKLEFQIDKMDNNKISTINKIINGEYKQGSSQIRISKKEKIELIISFSFESKELNLNKNRILGIDLGIVNVATMAIWDNNTKNYDYINYKRNVLSGQELIKFRQKLFNMGMSNKEIEKEIEEYNEKLHQKQLNKHNVGSIDGIKLLKYRNTIDKRKKELSISSKCVGKGREGHGYNSRMKPLERIRKKASNFADTFNHKYSKYIIDFAIKNNCGIIQMEDLSGATQYTHEKFLKNWSYYDLQNKIEYKAKEVGIEVIKINPRYTSKRCSKCGCIHVENRDCKNNQSKFECVVCGHKENADINASKNIAIPYIDKIITDYIKNKIK